VLALVNSGIPVGVVAVGIPAVLALIAVGAALTSRHK